MPPQVYPTKVVGESPEGQYRFRIRPTDIELMNGQTAGRFGKQEVEVTAGTLVSFFKRFGIWQPFTIEELKTFYLEVGKDPNTMFFGLIGDWFDDGDTNCIRQGPRYLVISRNGKYRVTEEFIKRCAGENVDA